MQTESKPDEVTECGYCGTPIHPTTAADEMSEGDPERYPWSDEEGSPVCVTVTNHEPRDPPVDWRAMFAKYAGIVGDAEGIDFLSATKLTPEGAQWTPEEWAAIKALDL